MGVLKSVRMRKATYFDDFIPFQRAEYFNTWTISNCQNFRRCDNHMKVIFRHNKGRSFQGEEAHQANQPSVQPDLKSGFPTLSLFFCSASHLNSQIIQQFLWRFLWQPEAWASQGILESGVRGWLWEAPFTSLHQDDSRHQPQFVLHVQCQSGLC